MSLSFTDRENLWIQAGGNPVVAPVAAAVSMAENTPGDPLAVSQTNDVGLWQINLDAHPEYQLSWLQTPINNARAAVAISGNGVNWLPWTTFRNGAYRAFLPGGTPGGIASSGGTQSNTPSCLFSNVGPVCLDGPLGAAAVALGLVLVVVGLYLLVGSAMHRTGVDKDVARAAVTVAKVVK